MLNLESVKHQDDCQCVICSEWGGKEPNWELVDPELLESDLPDPFMEVMGG